MDYKMYRPFHHNNGKFVIMSPNHSKLLLKSLVSMVERSYLVDITICCGTSTVQAHKIILAANSPYFKENLENKEIAQIIITGMEFAVLKSFIEYMYCGEMYIYEEHMKYFFAAAKLFQIPNMEAIFSDADMQRIGGEQITIPPPQFITKLPKFPTMYKPLNSIGQPPPGYCLVTAYKPKRKINPAKEEMPTYDDGQPDEAAALSSLGDDQLLVENNEGPMYNKNYQSIDDAMLLATTAVPESSFTPQKFELSSLDDLLEDKSLGLLMENHDGAFASIEDAFFNEVSDTKFIQVFDTNDATGKEQELQPATDDDPTYIDIPKVEKVFNVSPPLASPPDLPSFDEDPSERNDIKYQETDLSLDDIINSVNSTTMHTDNFESLFMDNDLDENCDPLLSDDIFDPSVFFNATIDTSIHGNDNTEYDEYNAVYVDDDDSQ